MKANKYIVSGRVQGVSFRYFTYKTARKLNISGTVQNLPDGDVEAIAQGEAHSIEEFERFLHSGPPLAHVLEVKVESIDINHPFTQFEIIY